MALSIKHSPQPFLRPQKTAITFGGGGGMEARVARLESDVSYIQRDIAEIKQDIREIKKDSKSDFRWLMAGGISGFILLASMMIAGYLRIESAIRSIAQ